MNPKTEIYYIIPRDVIYFQNPRNPLPLSAPKSIFSNIVDNHQVDISLVALDEVIEKSLTDHHFSNINPYQILFEIKITGQFNVEFYLKDSLIREYLVLSLMLAQKEHKKFHYDYGTNSFSEMPDNAYVTLPYAFLKFNAKNSGVNAYYQADYLKLRIGTANFYNLLDSSQLQILSQIFNKVISSTTLSIKQPIIDMFIHALTLPWNKSGTFFPSIVSIFCCFESILNKQSGQWVKNLYATYFGHGASPLPEYEVLKDLQDFRNGIAHMESHDIIDIGSGVYNCLKSSNGSLKTVFSIDKLDSSRKLLTDLFVDKL